MALKVFLRHPWYAPDGLYRRAVDNPHIVEADLKDLPSTAEVEEGGKKQLVWKLRGEEDPATRAQTAGEEAEARKNVPLAKALMNPKGAVRDDSELLAKIKKLEEDNAALMAQLMEAKEEEETEEKEEPASKPAPVPPASPAKK